ncbi:MAG: TRAP transporter substrate-binding protein [Gammaproteobacteria bacterium]|nr:TRAP transporter substrate-binding protein [Gammaproteobacteria bacterium]MDE0368002.1 TRAP transporter substrate-binding protein [Gammaproteobacteria bacterium]
MTERFDIAVRGWRWVLVTILLPALTQGCGAPEAGYLFRYGHSQPAQAPRSQSMVFFERELEQRTDGRISVENYFSATLGSEREMMDMVATGVLQGTRGGLFADANPKFVLFMVPFLVGDWDQALRLVNSDLARRINAGARRNGFHIPATGISQGFRAHTNSIRPIKNPGDLAGLKMRVPPQEIYVLTARALGASPHEMPASELYSALKTGVLDGQDNPPSNIWDYKLFEVQAFMTVSNYATGPDPFIVDLNWYESLPADLRMTFDQVAEETIALSDKLNRESEEKYIARLAREMELIHLRPEEIQSFRRLTEPVARDFIARGVFTADEVNEAREIAGRPAAPFHE